MPNQYLNALKSDCENCFGYCCVALYFSAAAGFPQDKEAGQPCSNLQPDFRCRIHPQLKERGLKGCMAYDCFGAGSKTAQVCFNGRDWEKSPATASTMFEVFLIIRQLHEMLWYLSQALSMQSAQPVHAKINALRAETEKLTHLSPDALIKLALPEHRARVNILLQKTCELVQAPYPAQQNKRLHPGADLIGADLRKVDLRGANLRGALLIAADLSGTNLGGTNFIGADLRDANLKGADLSHSIFLTQFQINSALGDHTTILPSCLNRPISWD